jgi:hypothetical protein
VVACFGPALFKSAAVRAAGDERGLWKAARCLGREIGCSEVKMRYYNFAGKLDVQIDVIVF